MSGGKSVASVLGDRTAGMKRNNYRVEAAMLRLVPLMLVSVVCVAAGRCDYVWFDGSRTKEGPPGKLLSDNDGFWGERICTGVEYKYERQPDNPPDRWRDVEGKFGRRLLDGRRAGNWWTPVGITGPLVVTFDFKRNCQFREIDVDSRNKKVAIEVATAQGPDGPWNQVFARGTDQCPDQQFHRLPLPEGTSGRYLRLKVEAQGITWLDEVLVWGEAEVSDEAPEAINPVYQRREPSPISFESIPGIDRTAFPDARFWQWAASLGDLARQPAVWSRVATWDAITDKPILPSRDEICNVAEVVMARNETECLALALTNTSCREEWQTKIALSSFRGPEGPASRVSGEVSVMGAIPSRQYGVNLGPLLSPTNMPAAGLLRRYLTNGDFICRFPRLVLSKGGSAVLW
ncbi:MAG: hypothetical protein H5T86_11210, partial [Armatimonadetes bacterium]|nr:hypothetical protein [Armatimonadota bacterium]